MKAKETLIDKVKEWQSIDGLKQKLFEFGDVEVFKKDENSLTLFMTGNELHKVGNVFTILGAVVEFCPAPNTIHVMKNSDTWLLLILKF